MHPLMCINYTKYPIQCQKFKHISKEVKDKYFHDWFQIRDNTVISKLAFEKSADLVKLTKKKMKTRATEKQNICSHITGSK